MKKRITRTLIPVVAASVISWLISLTGTPFPWGLVIIGVILSYLVYHHWEEAYSRGESAYRAGERVYQILHDLPKTIITEVKNGNTQKEPPKQTEPKTEKPVTGHFTETPEPVEEEKPEQKGEEEPEPEFVIGKTEDGRTITMREISSLGVGGVPGSGKTVSMVGICAQAVVKYRGNVRFLVVDPHMLTGSPQALSAGMSPLAPFYLKHSELPNPVSGGNDLLKWIRWMTSQAKDRIGGKVPIEDQVKLVLIADEFTALMDDEEIASPLTELLLRINEQARKVGVFAVVASPQWKSSRIQGTEVRNTIASFLVHNMPPNIARQLVPNGIAEIANDLEQGQAIFSSMGRKEIVRVPYMSHGDILKCIEPYLPTVAEPTVSGTDKSEDQVPEPGIAEVRSIYETYCMLNRDLDYSEDNAIRALAIHFYPADPRGEERIKLALKLGEQHL